MRKKPFTDVHVWLEKRTCNVNSMLITRGSNGLPVENRCNQFTSHFFVAFHPNTFLISETQVIRNILVLVLTLVIIIVTIKCHITSFALPLQP